MRRMLLVGFVATVLAGCFGLGSDDGRRRSGDDGWWSDDERPARRDETAVDPECRRERGKVDEAKWQARVDEFLNADWRKKKGFKAAKAALVRDLEATRERACDWEKQKVTRLIHQVQDHRYADTQ